MQRPLLLCFALLIALTGQAAGLEQLRSFLAATHSLSGRFEQSVQAASAAGAAAKPRVSAGSFALLRPGKFRWAYDSPYRQLLVCDGVTLWSWDPDLNQATRRKVGGALDASPAALLAGADFERHFRVKEAGSANGVDSVLAEPKAADSAFASARIGFAQGLPRVMEIRDRFDQITTLKFSSVIANPPLSSSEFRFVPPAKADVIKDGD